jgi:hypothetical protein
VSAVGANLVPLAALGVPEVADAPTDLPMAYIPRMPQGATFRDVLDRAVGWGRR